MPYSASLHCFFPCLLGGLDVEGPLASLRAEMSMGDCCEARYPAHKTHIVQETGYHVHKHEQAKISSHKRLPKVSAGGYDTS